MRVLVTGATGFVGRALVPLLLARGHQIRAAVRQLSADASGIRLSPSAQTSGLRERPDAHVPGADLAVVGDIGPDTDWSAALDGVDAVVHLAARVHVMRDTVADPLAAFRRTNTEGTRRLAEAAAERGVRRFVYLSSIKAVVDESRPEPVTDTTPADPHSPYGISKREAEQALEELNARGVLDPVILRPPLVYGPGVAGNLRTLLTICQKRLPLPLAWVDNRRSLIFVGNLADAVATALTHPNAGGKSFLVSDGTPLSTADLVRHLSAGLGVTPRLLPAPTALLALAATLAGKRDAWDRVGGSLVLDDAGIRATLDWSPPVDAASGLHATAEWFKALHGRTV